MESEQKRAVRRALLGFANSSQNVHNVLSGIGSHGIEASMDTEPIVNHQALNDNDLVQVLSTLVKNQQMHVYIDDDVMDELDDRGLYSLIDCCVTEAGQEWLRTNS